MYGHSTFKGSISYFANLNYKYSAILLVMVFKFRNSCQQKNSKEDVEKEDRDDIHDTSIQNRWISQLMSKSNKRHLRRRPRCCLLRWMLSWYDTYTELFTEHWCLGKKVEHFFLRMSGKQLLWLLNKNFLNSSTRFRCCATRFTRG